MTGIMIALGAQEDERVILSGTTGSPNADTDFSLGGVATAGWSFLVSGDLTKISGGAYSKPEWFGIAGQTTHETPDQTYYIRATLDAGNAPDNGATLNVWHSLASARFWSWQCGPGFASNAGTLKIEIARDSGGTDIVDTGYYRGTVTSEL